MLDNVLNELKDDYSEIVNSASESNSPEIIGNRAPWQTRIVMNALLEKAMKLRADVSLISGSIPKEFYNDSLVDVFQECVDAGCNIRIAIWNDDPNVISNDFKKLTEHERVELRVGNPSTLGITDDLPHCLIVGDNAYRYEYPHEDLKDKTFSNFEPEVRAAICFNDKEWTGSLKNYFNSAWKVATPLFTAN